MKMKMETSKTNIDFNEYKGGQFKTGVNVYLTHRNKKTGKILHEFSGSNRVTRRALFGLVKFMNNEFNVTIPETQKEMNSYLPRFLALGTNNRNDRIGSSGSVSKEVTVMDTQLLSEIYTSDGNCQRIQLSSQGKIENKTNLPYVKLTLSCFIGEELFNGNVIGELGLFTEDNGDNCWARIVLGGNQFEKTEGTVIDITWDITVVSMDSQNQPYEDLDSNKEILREIVYKSLELLEPTEEGEQRNLYNKLMYEVNFSQAVIAYNMARSDLVEEARTRLSSIYDEYYNKYEL